MAKKRYIYMSNNENYVAKLREETAAFLHKKGPWNYFVTLNFRCKVSKQQVRNSYVPFIGLLNGMVFDPKSDQSVVAIPVVETHRFEGCHLHVLMKDPSDRSPKGAALSRDTFKEYIGVAWNNASSKTANVKQSGNGWFQDVYDGANLARYLTKQIRAWDSDAVFWDLVTDQRRRDL